MFEVFTGLGIALLGLGFWDLLRTRKAYRVVLEKLMLDNKRMMDDSLLRTAELQKLLRDIEAARPLKPLDLPQKEPMKPLTDAEAQALDLAKARGASYQEAVASRYRGVPVRQTDLAKPIRFVTPNRPTQTDSSSRYQEDNSLTGTILTAVAVSSIFDSDSSSSSSPDPAPSWDSSDSSSGSGFGGGGSSDSW